MESNTIFRVLFFLQSAAFFIFIILYSQNSGIVYTQPAAVKNHNICTCAEIEVPKTHHIGYSPSPARTYHVDYSPTKASLRGKLSNCTLEDIKHRPGVMMLTSTNMAFLDLTMNMLESIKRMRLCVNTTIIAEDDQVYKYLQKRSKDDPGVQVVITNSGEVQSTAITTRHRTKYFNFLKKRQPYILQFLEKGYDVLFSDADTFWFQDPFPFFQGDFDISAIDSANPFGVRSKRSNFCAGFVYYKNTKSTLLLVKAWIEYMLNRNIMDQNALNILMNSDKPVHINFKPLDTNIFPYGPKFYELLEKKANYSTVVMHAASIHGHDSKVAKFKSSNMWLINATNQELLASV